VNPRRLTAKQEACVVLVVGGMTQTDAYKQAYPTSQKWANEIVWSKSARLFMLPYVAARLQELRDKAAEQSVWQGSQVLDELRKLVHSDIGEIINEHGRVKLPHELDAKTRAAVKTFKIDEYGRIEYQFYDKNPAIDKAMKHMGLYEKDNKQKTDALGDLLNSLSGKVVSPVAQNSEGK